MIIYRKKKTSFFNSLLIIFLISLFFLLLITPGFKGDIEQSLRILLKQPVLYKSKPLTDSKFLDYSIKSFNAIKNYIFQTKNYDELKTLTNIKLHHMSVVYDKKTNTFYQDRIHQSRGYSHRKIA